MPQTALGRSMIASQKGWRWSNWAEGIQLWLPLTGVMDKEGHEERGSTNQFMVTSLGFRRTW